MSRRATRPGPTRPTRPRRAGRCDMPGCEALGEYRAPKSRRNLKDYWWFCLEHVRAYNATWDYYKGMSPAQIEAQLRADTAWQRPSWPLGRLGTPAAWDEEVLRDPLHLLAAGRVEARPAQRRRPDAAGAARAAGHAGPAWPTTLDAVKTRYKELAKRHHPDANGGDRAAEERLKTINLAYAALRSRLTRDAQRGGRRVIAPARLLLRAALQPRLDFSSNRHRNTPA